MASERMQDLRFALLNPKTTTYEAMNRQIVCNGIVNAASIYIIFLFIAFNSNIYKQLKDNDKLLPKTNNNNNQRNGKKAKEMKTKKCFFYLCLK